MDEFNAKCQVERNEELGRYVFATGDIKAGETVLLERPVLILPCGGEKRCANCLKLADGFCSICQIFPMCSNCKQHNAFDCQLLAQMQNLRIAELQQNISHIYGPLKSLLLHENSETTPHFEQLMQLEAHMEQRRNTDIWREHAERCVMPLLNSGLPAQLSKTQAIDEELLQRLCGIVDVNSFEIRAPDAGTMRGIYVRGALLNHSCVANTNLSIDAQYRIKIYANQDIAKGEMVCDCYTNVLLGTAERRQLLQVGKYFHCSCARCSDPTELGSHMSSLICVPCASNKREGYVVRKETEQKWQCNLCEHTLPPSHVEKVLERAKEEIFHAKDDLYRYEVLLAKLGQMLHRNHYLMIDLKQNIAAILRAIIMNLAQRPGRRVYERKVRLCQEILLVLQPIQPGFSRLKAIALYELSNASAELSRLRFGENDVTELELVKLLQQSEAMLREAIRMLLYEPVETPEGQMMKDMLRELKDLQNDIQLVQNKQDE